MWLRPVTGSRGGQNARTFAPLLLRSRGRTTGPMVYRRDNYNGRSFISVIYFGRTRTSSCRYLPRFCLLPEAIVGIISVTNEPAALAVSSHLFSESNQRLKLRLTRS